MKELNEIELREVDGGFFPALILIGWGAMLLCDAITLGLGYGYYQNK
ncbi:MAG TPA: class IIb bacteriocin, lactobin A/cerein 7B family [Prolixibacteraceae bacterium]|nr:class IIb bacteriocin, lactobin A/cerein 7B family [Prolixibacteraceae bacterium]